VEVCVEIFTPASYGDSDPPPRLIEVPEECSAVLDEKPEVFGLGNEVRRIRHRLSIRLEKVVQASGTFVRPVNISIRDGLGASALVSWTVRQAIMCAPAQFHFGAVGPGEQPVTRKVIVRSVDGRPFRVLDVNDSPYLTVKPVPHGVFPTSSANEHAVELAFELRGEESSRFLSGSVRMRIDREDCPETRLPWSAFVRRDGGNWRGK
jgi:hypothetical protein